MSRHRTAFDMTPAPPTNTLRLNVDASIDLRELAAWPPDTSRALLLGVAQVLAAQKEAEHVR